MQLQHGDSFPFVQNLRAGDLRWCQVCGRALGESGQYWVEVFDGGDIWDESIHGPADRNDAGFMGKYPVGITCAKKFTPSVLVWEHKFGTKRQDATNDWFPYGPDGDMEGGKSWEEAGIVPPATLKEFWAKYGKEEN